MFGPNTFARPMRIQSSGRTWTKKPRTSTRRAAGRSSLEKESKILMKMTLIAFSFVAGIFAICFPSFAHHGNAAYEANLTEVKNATVTRLVWANPHTLVLFDAPDEKGEVVHWNAEMGSPSALANVG